MTPARAKRPSAAELVRTFYSHGCEDGGRLDVRCRFCGTGIDSCDPARIDDPENHLADCFWVRVTRRLDEVAELEEARRRKGAGK